MLVRDLYQLRPGRRASAVLDELAVDAAGEPSIVEARLLLTEVDTLEAGVRAGEPTAIARAATLALAVEARLRALLETA